MALTTINSDVRVNGSFTAESNLPSTGSVTNSTVASDAALESTKLIMMHRVVADFSLDALANPSTGTTFTQIVHRALGAGTIRNVNFLMLDTGSQANTNDFTFDLKIVTAGDEILTSALAAAIVLDTDTVDNTAVAGSLSTTALVAGDLVVAEVVTPATITGAQGMIAVVDIDENPV